MVGGRAGDPKLQNWQQEAASTGPKWESEWSTAMSTHGNCKDGDGKKAGKSRKAGKEQEERE